MAAARVEIPRTTKFGLEACILDATTTVHCKEDRESKGPLVHALVPASTWPMIIHLPQYARFAEVLLAVLDEFKYKAYDSPPFVILHLITAPTGVSPDVAEKRRRGEPTTGESYSLQTLQVRKEIFWRVCVETRVRIARAGLTKLDEQTPPCLLPAMVSVSTAVREKLPTQYKESPQFAPFFNMRVSEQGNARRRSTAAAIEAGEAPAIMHLEPYRLNHIQDVLLCLLYVNSVCSELCAHERHSRGLFTQLQSAIWSPHGINRPEAMAAAKETHLYKTFAAFYGDVRERHLVRGAVVRPYFTRVASGTRTAAIRNPINQEKDLFASTHTVPIVDAITQIQDVDCEALHEQCQLLNRLRVKRPAVFSHVCMPEALAMLVNGSQIEQYSFVLDTLRQNPDLVCLACEEEWATPFTVRYSLNTLMRGSSTRGGGAGPGEADYSLSRDWFIVAHSIGLDHHSKTLLFMKAYSLKYVCAGLDVDGRDGQSAQTILEAFLQSNQPAKEYGRARLLIDVLLRIFVPDTDLVQDQKEQRGIGPRAVPLQAEYVRLDLIRKLLRALREDAATVKRLLNAVVALLHCRFLRPEAKKFAVYCTDSFKGAGELKDHPDLANYVESSGNVAQNLSRGGAIFICNLETNLPVRARECISFALLERHKEAAEKKATALTNEVLCRTLVESSPSYRGCVFLNTYPQKGFVMTLQADSALTPKPTYERLLINNSPVHLDRFQETMSEWYPDDVFGRDGFDFMYQGNVQFSTQTTPIYVLAPREGPSPSSSSSSSMSGPSPTASNNGSSSTMRKHLLPSNGQRAETTKRVKMREGEWSEDERSDADEGMELSGLDAMYQGGGGGGGRR